MNCVAVFARQQRTGGTSPTSSTEIGAARTGCHLWGAFSLKNQQRQKARDGEKWSDGLPSFRAKVDSTGKGSGGSTVTMDLFLFAVFPALILQGTSVIIAFSELSILDFCSDMSPLLSSAAAWNKLTNKHLLLDQCKKYLLDSYSCWIEETKENSSESCFMYFFNTF